jgi:hypothetical protein
MAHKWRKFLGKVNKFYIKIELAQMAYNWLIVGFQFGINAYLQAHCQSLTSRFSTKALSKSLQN